MVNEGRNILHVYLSVLSVSWEYTQSIVYIVVYCGHIHSKCKIMAQIQPYRTCMYIFLCNFRKGILIQYIISSVGLAEFIISHSKTIFVLHQENSAPPTFLAQMSQTKSLFHCKSKIFKKNKPCNITKIMVPPYTINIFTICHINYFKCNKLKKNSTCLCRYLVDSNIYYKIVNTCIILSGLKDMYY